MGARFGPSRAVSLPRPRSSFFRHRPQRKEKKKKGAKHEIKVEEMMRRWINITRQDTKEKNGSKTRDQSGRDDETMDQHHKTGYERERRGAKHEIKVDEMMK